MSAEIKFERETCSRCYGSGEHSYCEMYGRTCFKCHGKGQTFTKRAQVAARWMNEQNLIPASEITVGMRIKALGVTITVREIGIGSVSKSLRDGAWIENPPHIAFQGQSHGVHLLPDSMVQMIRSREAQIELLRAAIEYQNALTKDGKPRKRPVMAEAA